MPDSRIDDFDYDCWQKVVGLTIYEAAFWMQIGSDPRGHQARYEQDNEYSANFEDNPYRAEAVCDVCQILIDAIHAGLIKTLGEVVHSNRDVDAKNTRIQKSDWLTWCRDNGYSDIANKTIFKKISTPVVAVQAVCIKIEQGVPPDAEAAKMEVGQSGAPMTNKVEAVRTSAP
ncbi:MAG: hypothetical protein ABI536_03160, partial [Gallionella sp.]